MTTPKNTLLKLRRELIASQKRIAKERDKLRDIIETAEQVADDCDYAVEMMNAAADKLSELQ